ncbi:hypothetical protein TRVL_03009 [Trypanosoma vivax]|nr:hypothetical protein TRVL_03009 [Trypanosoma vivax]
MLCALLLLLTLRCSRVWAVVWWLVSFALCAAGCVCLCGWFLQCPLLLAFPLLACVVYVTWPTSIAWSMRFAVSMSDSHATVTRPVHALLPVSPSSAAASASDCVMFSRSICCGPCFAAFVNSMQPVNTPFFVVIVKNVPNITLGSCVSSRFRP